MLKTLSFIVPFTFCLLAQAAPTTYDINFKIFNVNRVSDTDETRIHEGVEFFNELLERRCGFRLNANITRADVLTEKSGPTFRNEPSWVPTQVGDNQTYFFRFYQKDMFELTTVKQLTQKKNEVSIFVVDNFDMCGFAFPDIQMTDSFHLSKNTDNQLNQFVLPWVQNRVIMGSVSTGPRECHNSNRIVSHELAHVFIQDESPHTCWDEKQGAYRPCPPDNILTTRVVIYPEPRGNGFPHPRQYDMSPSEPEVRPAVGTDITERQCNSILSTVRNMTY